MSASALIGLDQHAIMTLATTRPDERPRATIVGYVDDGLAIYVLISRTR